MIESIYNNSKNEKEGHAGNDVMFKMPKNIRQIGENAGNKRIYIEDYVMSYVKQIEKEKNVESTIIILLGKIVQTDKEENIFVNGAIQVNSSMSEGKCTFSNEIWSDIYEKIKKYFTSVEIVGWFIPKNIKNIENDKNILKMHINNFAGEDKTLLIYDEEDDEEIFYLYENNTLKRKKGYYIYYEKNEEMQNYMVENRKVISEETQYDDRAVQKIREIIENKNDEKIINRGTKKLIYAGSIVTVMMIASIGAAIFNNYDHMKNIEKTLNVITEHLSGKDVEKKDIKVVKKDTKAVKKDKDDVTVVETISGNVKRKSNLKGKKDVDLENETETGKGKGKVREIKSKIGTDNKQTDKKHNSNKKIVAKNNKVKPINNKNENKNINNKANKKQVSSKKTNNRIVYYTVKSGESLASISLKNYGTLEYVDKIKKINKIIDEDFIVIGEKIILP